MFTPGNLMDRAVKAQETYESLLSQYPPGTVHADRNDAYREMEQSLACAEWMETRGHAHLANVGPFESTVVTRGSRVRIRKGARIYSTQPNSPREGVEANRAQQVKVHSIDKGYVDTSDHSPTVVQGKVRWAGAGGYWRWTDINNVEIGPA